MPFDWLLVCGAAVALCSFFGLLFCGNNRLRVIIVFLSLAVGFFWFWAYTSLFVTPYWDYNDEVLTVTATITDYPVARQPRGYRVDARMQPDGKSPVRVRFYYYNEAELKPGDIAEVTARFRRTDISKDGESIDTFTSRGIYLSGAVSGNIAVTDENRSIRYVPKRIAESIANKIDEVYPEDTAPFMQALLMGKRNELYQDTALTASLSASGIIHIVSISGMHISFLMGFLMLIIRSKRIFAIYAIPALLLFMAMTGFTPAVTRAGIMQVFLIIAPLLRRERDSITSLSAALFVLLAVNPYSVASAGLQLSFFATLGIILLTAKINSAISESLRGNKQYRKSIPRKAINFITSSLSTTIGALIFTLPLTALHFGYVSLIAPITNLLTIGAVSFAFPFGLTATLIGFLSPFLCSIAIFPVTMAARYIILIAHTFAAVPYSIVYSSNAYIMFWLAYVYLVFTALPLLKARLRQYIYPCCITFLLFFCVVLLSTTTTAVASGSTVTVLDVGQGLSVAVLIDEFTMLIDCGSNSSGNAGEAAHGFLMSVGITSVDLLVITHFHADHINGVEFLLSRIAVSALAIPDPEGSYLAEDIIELARKRGTDIIYVSEIYSIVFDDISLYIYPPLGIGDENERGLSILTVGDINALITGDMNSSTERALLRYAALPKLDLLVVGHHGSKYSTSEELLNALLPEIAIIPVGKNSFGHPSPEVLGRLERIGAATYRTDEFGHITVHGG